MSRSVYKPLFLLIGLVCSQASGPLWAQSFGTISTVAGRGTQGFAGDGGQATQALLFNPSDIAVNTNGELYIADTFNNRIRKVDANGIITTIAGTGTSGYNGDSKPATIANLNHPSGIAFDLSGDLYISDTDNNRIRRVDAITGIITTVAGTGESGSRGDNGPATNAQLNSPYHIAFDAIGNLYIADAGNNEIRRVLENNQTISTFAGTGRAGDNGDDQSATTAKLNYPLGILVGAAGDVYIGDFGNHRVRRVDQGGFIRTFAGTGEYGYSGDGGPAAAARLKGPIGLGNNAAGDIFIADSLDHRVRQVNILTGIIITVAGNGQNGYTGDGGPAEGAEVGSPSSVFDLNNRLYISQFGSDVIRAVNTRGVPVSISVAGGSIQTTAAGTAFAQPLVALVRDVEGNPVPGVPVVFSVPLSGATATLSTRLVTTDDLGKASVSATANTVVGAYQVLAAAAQVSSLAGFQLTNTAGVAATIEFLVQPTDTNAGVAIAPAVKVRLKDAYGNPVVGAQVSLGGPDLASGGGFQTTDSSGIVTYGNLKYEKAGAHQLSASGPNTAVSSNPFTITAGSPGNIIAQSGQGQTASVNATYAVPLKAVVNDAFGNGIAGISVTFTAPSTGPSVTFSSTATATTNVFGIATAPQMTANAQTGAFVVTAAASGIQTSAMFGLINVAGPATKLAFVQQPTDTAAGAAMTPAVTVQLQDSLGNNVTTPGVAVTLQANPVAGRAAGFNVTQNTNLSGIATFSSLTFSQVGQFTLLAEASLITSATSTAFTIRAGAPATIQATGGTPQSAAVLTPFAQQLQVTVFDSSNNPVSGATVTFAAPGSGASATLSAASASTDANGHAAVTATAGSVAGLYSVTAATAGVSGNASFSLTNLTGAVGHITFVQKPSNAAAGAVISPPVTVRVTDAGSNPITGASVTISVQGGTPALGGTLSATTDATGLATFADLSITVAGRYRLEAVSSGMSVASDSFLISAATSAVVVLAFQGDGQSAAVGTNYSGPLQARVEDSYHNPVANASVTFAAPITGASVTFSGSTTVTSGADGLATAPPVTANSQTGTFQVTASTAAASAPAAFNLTNVPGSANKLAFVQQPVDTVAGATITPSVTVQIQDSGGNAVHTAGIMVTLQANASVRRLKELSGTVTETTDANGLATFANLSISQAGTYTLQANSSGLSSATSAAFRITAGAAANIQATSGTPQSATILTAFTLPLQATVLDSNNNPVSGATVTFTTPSGASATLSAPSAVTDASGHAIVTATANSVAGSYAVTAATAGVSGNANFALTNTTGATGQISYTQQPSNTPAGTAISPAVTVLVTDAGSNPVSGATVTIHVRGSAAPISGTLTEITNSSGVAAFADLSITVAGTYQLEVVSGGISAVSNSFQISAATSAVVILAFQGDGQSAAVGANYGGPLQARVEDSYHNPIAGASVTFGAPTTGASVAFSGATTVTSGADGLATSPTMTANSQAGTFQVTATTSVASGPALFNLTNVPGSANKLAFLQQPVDTVAGATIPAVTVQLQDSAGNAVHTAGIIVTLQADITVRRLKELSGTGTQTTDANGLATFANLSISQAGTYTLQANSTGLSSATSNPFAITVGTAASIHATGGTPQSTAILSPFAQQLQVTVLDSFSNPVSGATVTFAAPGAGASATLSAPSAVTDANGIAAVMATANGMPGLYSVTAATAGISGNTSFALTNVTGGISQIAFAQHPSNTQAGVVIDPAVTVVATDAASNPLNGVPITISVQGGTAALGGTLTVNTNASGVATFADLRLTTAGSYQLQAVSASMSAVSNSFQVSSSASSAVISVFEGDGQSAAVGTSYSGPLKAKVQDLHGNPLPGATMTFAAPASGASASFAGPATVTTGADGIAVSPAMTANSQTGAFQVTATIPNSTAPAVFNLTNVPGGANKLAFVQQPSDTSTGATINPPVTVQLQDSSGNAVPMAGVPVAVQANASVQKQLAGNTSQTTDANGLATFANLSISQAGSYTLQATTSGLASATSNSFKITAGLATSILATGGASQSAIVQTAFGIPLQASVSDAFGNPIIGVTVVFAAPTSGPSGLFSGQSTISVITDAQGHASAAVTANNIAGAYGVTASATSVTGSAVFALTNLPPAASALAFVQQPGNTAAGQAIAPPITVQVVDSTGHAVSVSGVPIIMSLSMGTGALSGSLVQLTDTNGIATFSDLSISQTGSKRLRAAGEQQVPADSNTFQIMAGPPANIAVYGGSPQFTTVGQPFPDPLQALVTDALGFPVSGVPVTFAVPATGGPGGTYVGLPVVTTDQNGLATSSTLVANGQAGNFLATATVTGAVSVAQFALTNLPQQNTMLVASPANLSFVQEIGEPAPVGQTVQITSSGQIPVDWTASSSASWLVPAPVSGTTPGLTVVSVNPAGLSVGNYSGSISLTTASGGVTTILVTYTINSKPSLVIAPPVLVFDTTGTSLPASQNLQATSSSRSIAYTVSTQVSTPPGGTWLKVSPNTGVTIGTVVVTADPTGLAQGIYNGSVLFSPTESGLNSVAVPVTLVVGCGAGGCIMQPTITVVVNAASFHPTGAPGAIMAILGSNFSDNVYSAAGYPLPLVLGQTSVFVDGIQAPLFYVSPTQINIQMPSAVLTSGGNVVVHNGAPGLRDSSSYGAALRVVDPGLFVTPDGRASAQNGDYTSNTPATPIPAGGLVILYLTGQGPVTPPVTDGTAVPAEPLSIVDAPVMVTIGSKNAQVIFQGLTPSLAGVAQLNVFVPAGLTPGDQPVIVTINGYPSNVGLITVKGN